MTLWLLLPEDDDELLPEWAFPADACPHDGPACCPDAPEPERWVSPTGWDTGGDYQYAETMRDAGR